MFHENNGQLYYWLDNRPIGQSAEEWDQNIIDIPAPRDSKRQCMRGTQIAVTGDRDAEEVTLFYQDRYDYLCCRYVFCIYSHAESETNALSESRSP